MKTKTTKSQNHKKKWFKTRPLSSFLPFLLPFIFLPFCIEPNCLEFYWYRSNHVLMGGETKSRIIVFVFCCWTNNGTAILATRAVFFNGRFCRARNILSAPPFISRLSFALFGVLLACWNSSGVFSECSVPQGIAAAGDGEAVRGFYERGQ